MRVFSKTNPENVLSYNEIVTKTTVHMGSENRHLRGFEAAESSESGGEWRHGAQYVEKGCSGSRTPSG